MPRAQQQRAKQSKRFTCTQHLLEQRGDQLDEESLQLKRIIDGEVVVQGLTYLCCGFEICPTTQRYHWQMYLEVSKKTTFNSIRTRLGLPRLALLVSKGSGSENVEYCSKTREEDQVPNAIFWTFGELMRQGSRSDLKAIQVQLDDGASIGDIANDNFAVFLQYRRGLRDYISLNQPDRSWMTEVIYIWGPTGTGKTRWAYEFDEDLWKLPSDGKWFDGYEGQSTVLIDEFRGQMKFSQFLELTDRYPMQVPVKGGFVKWLPHTIIITGNQPLESQYPGVQGPAHRAAFMRRVDHVMHFPILRPEWA